MSTFWTSAPLAVFHHFTHFILANLTANVRFIHDIFLFFLLLSELLVMQLINYVFVQAVIGLSNSAPY